MFVKVSKNIDVRILRVRKRFVKKRIFKKTEWLNSKNGINKKNSYIILKIERKDKHEKMY